MRMITLLIWLAGVTMCVVGHYSLSGSLSNFALIFGTAIASTGAFAGGCWAVENEASNNHPLQGDAYVGCDR